MAKEKLRMTEVPIVNCKADEILSMQCEIEEWMLLLRNLPCVQTGTKGLNETVIVHLYKNRESKGE